MKRSTGGFSRYVTATGLLLLAFALVFTGYYLSERSIDLANAKRFDSQNLAAEVRQSSADLTSMVRSYVETGDIRYRRWYDEIVQIRDGKRPLPPHYDGLYWTFRVAGIQQPAVTGSAAASLTSRMWAAGFTPDELNFLQGAIERSNQLALLEKEVMDQAASPDPKVREKARARVYGGEYQSAKAVIMRPIGDFLAMVDRRTLTEVQEALDRTKIMVAILVFLGLSFIASLAATYAKLYRVLGAPVDHVRARIEALGTGDFQSSSEHPRHAGSVAGWLEKTRLELRDLYNQLVSARDQAESANKAKSTFLATMSHEIRTPLHGIIGINHLLSFSELDEHQRELLEQSMISADHLLKVLNDVLDVSKIEAGELELENQPFNLTTVMGELNSIFGPLAQQKGVAFELHLPVKAAAPVTGDGLRVSQVLANLVSNAVKFTEQGRIDVTLEVETEVDRLNWAVIVEDTGIGVTPDALPRLFQPFQQADGSFTRRYGGTGLGLSIAKSLIERMGGTVSFQNREGGGSRFRVSLGLPIAFLCIFSAFYSIIT